VSHGEVGERVHGARVRVHREFGGIKEITEKHFTGRSGDQSGKTKPDLLDFCDLRVNQGIDLPDLLDLPVNRD
jgi:hypothetical protein